MMRCVCWASVNANALDWIEPGIAACPGADTSANLPRLHAQGRRVLVGARLLGLMVLSHRPCCSERHLAWQPDDGGVPLRSEEPDAVFLADRL